MMTEKISPKGIVFSSISSLSFVGSFVRSFACLLVCFPVSLELVYWLLGSVITENVFYTVNHKGSEGRKTEV